MCKKFCKFRFHKLQTKETPSKLISKLIWMIIPTAQILDNFQELFKLMTPFQTVCEQNNNCFLKDLIANFLCKI